MSEGFIFYQSFADALEALPAEDYKECVSALCKYAINGEEVPFHKKSPHIVCNTTKLLECMRDAATFFMVKGMENANETNPKKIIEVMNDAMKKVEEILEDIAE